MLRLVQGGVMSDPDAPLKLEVVNDDFVLTPALCKLLVKLARRHLEVEARQNETRTDRDGHAA